MSVKRINAGPRMSGAAIYGDTVYVADRAKGRWVKEQTADILELEEC